ncbi:MAG: trypsin-like peptidase domain-containing protein [Ignavibacteria bacterium]|nr:trypsin-like peptidase domain-containing protein [Ignavibacteria bacterium]
MLQKILLTIIIPVFIFINSSYSQNGTVSQLIEKGEDDFNAEQIIEKYKPALISIWMNDDNYYSYNTYSYIDTTVLNGSGFIINEDGLIGTNYHVIEGIDSLIVKTSDGTFYDAELIYTDDENDFAFIKIVNPAGQKFPFVSFGNSDDVKAGQEVFAIGSPLGFEYTISSGIIAAIRENEKVSFQDPLTYLTKEKTFDKVLQVTAAISPGNSGGALFNKKGQVIGITTYTYVGYGNLNFAVAINGFKKLKDSVESKDFVSNEDIKVRKEESLFNSNYKLASALKSQLYYDWYYSKQKDSMKTIDSFLVRMDSLNRVNFSKAEKYYEKCIELKPDTFIVYQDLLDMYVFTDNFQKADSLYKNIRNSFDSDSLLNLLSSNLAAAYSTSKDYNKAIQFYEKMLAQDTTQYFIYFQIANLYNKMNENDRAVREYKNVLKRDSNYTEVYIQLGKIYYEKYKNRKLAKKYLQKAYEKELFMTGNPPYNPDVHFYLGMIAVKEGRKLDAILSYMDLKNAYDAGTGIYDLRLELYKAINKMEEQ